LFEHEPEYLPRVRQFQSKVQDFSEFLVSLPSFREARVPLRLLRAGLESSQAVQSVLPAKTSSAAAPRKVAAYQDACHLRHAQRVTAQPRALLQRVEGLELVELTLPDQCCGSAGVYNLEHPEMSKKVLEGKVDDILKSGAELVVTGNPGCMMQIEKGLREAGSSIAVEHIATVLDAALGGSAS
jgi:glycolate oxidase iron-sulfur subunit